MKAIQIHGPKDARLEDVPYPSPGPDDVLIKVNAVAICATNVELCDGSIFYITRGLTQYPSLPNHESSWKIEEVGTAVTEFSVRDRVVGE